jgi:hypothetical protein
VIGTLVERTIGYTMLLHLPEGYKPEQVRDVLAAKINIFAGEFSGDAKNLALPFHPDVRCEMGSAGLSALSSHHPRKCGLTLSHGFAHKLKTIPALMRPESLGRDP